LVDNPEAGHIREVVATTNSMCATFGMDCLKIFVVRNGEHNRAMKKQGKDREMHTTQLFVQKYDADLNRVQRVNDLKTYPHMTLEAVWARVIANEPDALVTIMQLDKDKDGSWNVQTHDWDPYPVEDLEQIWEVIDKLKEEESEESTT